jgi:Na+/melibiose symporter-like transporter
VAIIIALAYPISSRMHADIRQAIAQRQAGLPAIDPLNPEQTLTKTSGNFQSGDTDENG